jgi:hypothetical protein
MAFQVRVPPGRRAADSTRGRVPSPDSDVAVRMALRLAAAGVTPRAPGSAHWTDARARAALTDSVMTWGQGPVVPPGLGATKIISGNQVQVQFAFPCTAFVLDFM